MCCLNLDSDEQTRQLGVDLVHQSYRDVHGDRLFCSGSYYQSPSWQGLVTTKTALCALALVILDSLTFATTTDSKGYYYGV